MTKREIAGLVVLVGLIAAGLALRTPLLSGARGVSWQVWVGTVGQVFRVGKLSVENDVMEQMEQLVAQNARLRSETAHYRQLKRQLGSLAFDDFKSISSEVTAQPLDPFKAHFILNKGADDGIILGAPVVIFGSTLVGFVTELSDKVAVWQAIVHPETSISVEVIEEDEVGRGLVRGRAFTGIELVRLPRDVELYEGQAVVTEAQGIMVPQGLLIGSIDTITAQEHEPYQEARLATPYDLDTIEAVNVLVAP